MPRDPFEDSVYEVTHSPFRLGDWTVLPDLNRLTRVGVVVHVESRVMEVLVYLARNHPRLVTRQQITDAVWRTEYISDNTLTHAIAELRSALGDNAKDPLYIETIHRRGYRLLVPMTQVEHHGQRFDRH
jgi:transcriptional activator of cad operon